MGDDNRIVFKNTDSSNSEIEQPRQPRNMQDLLRYAIEAESHGGPNHVPSYDAGPLDPERRQFLENVISSMTVDVIKELKNCLSVLQSEYRHGEDSEKFEEAFEQIFDYCDNIDVANDFFKLGGFDVCRKWLETGPPELKWRAANVIGECCQNNPLCQTKAAESGLLKFLMELAEKEPEEMVKLKSFHAVSSIVRNNDSTLLVFLSFNGHKLILECLKSPFNKVKTKAAFLTSAIADKEVMLKDQFWDIGLASELASLITNASKSQLVDDVSCFEQCLSAMLCLVKDSKRKLPSVTKLMDELTQLRVRLSGDSAYMESLEYIQLIESTLQKGACG